MTERLPWTIAEDDLIRENYGKSPAALFSSAMPHRTWRAIQARAHKIGAAGKCAFGQNRCRLEGEYALLFLDARDGSETIATISIADLPAVLAFGKWRSHRNPRTGAFYVRSKNTYLHRFLMQPAQGQEVDHIDGDTLNNTRNNLRVVSHSANAQNLSIVNPNNKSSGIKNVQWNKTLRLWAVRIKVNGKQVCKYAKNLEAATTIADELRKRLHPFHSRP